TNPARAVFRPEAGWPSAAFSRKVPGFYPLEIRRVNRRVIRALNRRAVIWPRVVGSRTAGLRFAVHRLADFALGLGFLLVLALVVGLLALGDGELDLGPALLEVEPQGHEREAALRRFGGELGDLTAVQQQLARPLRLVVQPIAHRVFRDIAAEQPDLAAFDLAVGIFETCLRFAQTLHLGAGEH